jgi:hypothetical protein
MSEDAETNEESETNTDAETTEESDTGVIVERDDRSDADEGQPADGGTGIRRQVLVLTAAVVVVMLVASVGFASLSDNPLVPDATLEARDDPDDYDLSEERIVGVVMIEHEGGEAVRVSETELVIGSRDSGIRFNRSNDWTVQPSNATFAVRLDGQPMTSDTRFEPQDRLRVVRTTGTVNFSGSFETRVRLFHLPSQQVLVDSQITVE